MLVSVVMPMRNAQAYVEEALASVLQERQLALEVVVVDDGSTDRSRALVQALAENDPRVRIVEGPCRGFAASFNTGLVAARGEVLMQCDADDLYPAGRIATQVAWLTANPLHDAVCGAMSMMDSKGRLVAGPAAVAQAPGADIEGELRAGRLRTSLCTFALRRRVIERVGLLREYFETSPDIDFQFRLGETCRVAYLPTNFYFYRLHESSVTHTQPTLRRQFFEDTARSFQRERLSGGSDALSRGTPPEPPSRLDPPNDSAALQIHGMLIGQGWRLLEQGRRKEALGVALRAVLHSPQRLAAWRNLALVGLRAVNGASKAAGKPRP